MLEILATLVLYICEIREVHQNLEKEKNPSGFFDFFSTLIFTMSKIHGGIPLLPDLIEISTKRKNPLGSGERRGPSPAASRTRYGKRVFSNPSASSSRDEAFSCFGF